MPSFTKPSGPKYLHVLLIGSWGTGKSHVMHTFPGLAVADSQHGESNHFSPRADRGEFPSFVNAEVNTFDELMDLMRPLQRSAGGIKTLGIDSLTPLHNALVQKHTNDKGTTFYGPIVQKEAEFGELLRSLPIHVVATAEPREVRAKVGEDTESGQKASKATDVVIAKQSGRFHDSLGHKFDYIFVMRRVANDSIARCIKAKDETKIKRGEEIRNLTYQVLARRILLPAEPPLKGEQRADAQVRGERVA